jgi:outer membrane lipopolysaccharide assembly protein LptE/RlpB
MNKLFIGTILTLFLVCGFLYRENRSLQKEKIIMETKSAEMQNDFDQKLRIEQEKQNNLEIIIKKNQQIRQTQVITLQDKKCLSSEFMEIINENF